MNGAQLMRGESLGPPVPPRDIDRYPRSVIVDFRLSTHLCAPLTAHASIQGDADTQVPPVLALTYKSVVLGYE